MPASHSITSVGGFKAQDEIKVELKPEPLILSLYTNVDRKYSLRHKGLSYENFKVIYIWIKMFYSYTALYIVFSSINPGVFAYDHTSRGASHLGDLHALPLLAATRKEVWHNWKICKTSWKHLINLNRIFQHISLKITFKKCISQPAAFLVAARRIGDSLSQWERPVVAAVLPICL